MEASGPKRNLLAAESCMRKSLLSRLPGG